jgi:hypothetical protein
MTDRVGRSGRGRARVRVATDILHGQRRHLHTLSHPSSPPPQL